MTASDEGPTRGTTHARVVIDDIVRQLERVTLWFALPVTLTVAGIELTSDRGTPMVAGYMMVQACLGAALYTLRRRSLVVRSAVLTAFAWLTQAFTIVQFGPTIGGAPMLVAAGLFSGVVFGRRAAWGVGLATLGLGPVCIFGLDAGIFASPDPSVNDFSQGATWVRKTIAFVLGIGAAGWLHLRLMAGLRHTVTEAEAALEERETERSRRVAMERELDRAERLDILGELAGGVGRKVASSLDELVARAEAAAAEAGPNDDLTADILEAARALKATARRLSDLDQDRGDAMASTPFDLAVTREVRQLMAADVRGVCAFHLDVQPSGNVPLGREAVQRIVRNLCLNAKDASPDGASVVVRVAPFASDPRSAGALLEVVDQGRGMSEEETECLFEPFFTTKGEQGTGLGLTEVHRLVTSVGGRIDVTSRPGHGTTVRVALPAVVVRPAAVSVDRRTSAPPRGTPSFFPREELA